MPNNTEQIKKRRNSILKKVAPNDDDTTGDVTTKIKRRISFSGKKSVKEFIAGEQEATIWGTSYEESAECLQANPTESGLVNVYEKRIVLRNRRVIVDPNSGNKRRSKKKVHIAENDKENIFVQPPEVCPSDQGESVVKAESPLESELTLSRRQLEDLKIQSALGTHDRLNAWSSTFDFINCSAAINKTITIENSVDVSLNEDELQMLKFRVPVTATDVSPNLTLDSLRDGLSPNIFSRSILMSEDDVKLLKIMREKKGVKALTETQIAEDIPHTSNKQIDIDMGNTLADTNRTEDKRLATLNVSQSMNEWVLDAKGSKRKTLIKTVDMEADKTQNDKNQTLKSGFMNLIRGTECEGKNRTTMHANQSMDVSQCEAAEVKSFKRKTITRAVNMEETGLRVDCMAKSNNTMDTSSMEINSPMRKKPMHDATSKPMDITNAQSTSQGEQIRRQTIHFESAAIDESLIHEVPVSMHVPETTRFEEDRINEESTYPNGDSSRPGVGVEDDQINCNISMELSVYNLPERESIATNPQSLEEQKTTKQHRQTVHFMEQGQMDLIIDPSRRRPSIHTPADMIEDSPKSEKFHHESTKTSDDKIGESPRPIKSIKSSKPNVPSRQTIYYSSDIMEIAIPITSPNGKQRHSIYTPTDILEDFPKPITSTETQDSEIYVAAPSASKITLKNIQSVYTPAEEDSPTKSTELRKSKALSRTIHGSDEMIEVAPVQLESSTTRNSDRKRESIYTPADLIEDSPKSTRTCEATKTNVRQQELPENQPSSISILEGYAKQHQSIYTTSDMNEDSHKSSVSDLQCTTKHRQSVYTPANMIEDSPKLCQSSVAAHKTTTKYRQSVYFPTDMIEDSPKTSRTSHIAFEDTPEYRQSICTSSKMNEESARGPESSVSALKGITQQNQSIHIPSDVIEDLQKSADVPPIQSAAPKVIVKHLNLQQGLSGNDAALRILKSQQDLTKTKPKVETKADDSFMNMSVFDELSTSANKMNFHKLNEEMFRGESKAFAEERKEKISLFDRLESNPDEEFKLDLFAKKHSAINCLLQPTRNSMKDYTMEWSLGKSLRNPRDSEYTMDLSIGKVVKPHETMTNSQKALSDSNTSIMDLSIDQQQMSATPLRDLKQRQTTHFHKELDLDKSNTLEQDELVSQTKRQTIHFNQDIGTNETKAPLQDDDCMDLSVVGLLKLRSNNSKSHTMNDKTMSSGAVAQISNDEPVMDLSMDQTLYSEQRNLENKSAMLRMNDEQTNKIYEDTMDVSTTVAYESLTKPRRQTICVSKGMELDESRYTAATLDMSTLQALNQPQRQTIYYNEDLELDSNSDHQLTQPVSKPSKQNLHFNHDLEIENIKKEPTNRRQTIHFNQDLEVEDISCQQESPPKMSNPSNHQDLGDAPKLTSKRQTLLFNDDLEEEDISQQQDLLPTSSKRYTTHVYQDLDLEDEQTSQVTKPSKQFNEKVDQQIRLFNETKRNTAENGLIASNSNRRTVHFQENNHLEESVQPAQDDSKNLLIADPNYQEQQPTPPLPRRLTILDDHPVDIEESPQKITARKPSFSRTLNFNAIQTTTSNWQTHTKDDMGMSIQDRPLVGDDSPLYYYNAKSKENETTAEIDRSLAEYLKAEVAATLFRTDMSMNVSENEQKTVYCDAEDDQQSKSRRQTSYEPVNIFEESGMQPLQRRQTLVDTKTAHQSRINLQTHSETGRNIKSTEPQTECENSMELDMSPEKPSQSKDTLTRKTIHFTNENAVDESFFDEKQSQPMPPNQKNRHTIFFNDIKNPISEMDVTLSVNKGKSTGIQSLKEILQESNMLFTQSKLLKPSGFDKRSTIYFAAKDNSMDMTTANENMECENPEGNVDPECTPTKGIFSKSRILQLIGSAKKLQSMKKSMEFIQQELANLGYPVHRDDSPEESVETRLHESHNPDIPRIPRRATTFKPKLFEESSETVDNPRRTTTNQQKQLQESSDTIEIPRRAMTFQWNDTLYLSQNEVDVTNMSQKSLYKFEDAPITISDVSTFVAQKPIPTSGETTHETCSPNTTEALCNLAKEDHVAKSSDSEDTTHNIDKFKKRYVELTCNSIELSNMMEDIEKTHLSLVNTLDEQSEVAHSACPQQTSTIDRTTEPDRVVATVASPSKPLNPISSVCRKCKRHRLSTTQNETTIGSFMFEPVPEYKMDLGALDELAAEPTISDIAKVWRQKMRESDSFNISDGSQGIALDDSVDDFIAALNNERLVAAERRLGKHQTDVKRETSFISRVRKQMHSKTSNWILNELLLAGGVLRFTHTRIRTFAILISFTPKDPRGIEVNFNEIQLVPNVLHSRQWAPFDHALHYQLLLELPFDLRKLCPTSENLFELLEHVELVTQDVLKTGKDMLYLVLTSPASLIRESSGSIYIRKYARTKTPQNEVKHTEFQIEVRNMKNLSYESIAVPPLYEFDEKTQLLPVGKDFLRIFLADPTRYLKT